MMLGMAAAGGGGGGPGQYGAPIPINGPAGGAHGGGAGGVNGDGGGLGGGLEGGFYYGTPPEGQFYYHQQVGRGALLTLDW